MGAAMSQCPSTGQLEQMLAEKLTGAEHDTVEAHVETCVSCQERLEDLARSTITTGASPQQVTRRSPDPPPELDEDFLRRLRLTPTPSRVPPSAHTPAPLPAERAPAPREQPRAHPASDWPAHGRLGQYELLEKIGRG